MVAGGLAGVIAGGLAGVISGGVSGTISTGGLNTISAGLYITISAGGLNTISGGVYGTISAGGLNTISAGAYGTISAGGYGTISGGNFVTISGGNYGTARINYEQCFGGGRFAAGAFNQERKWFFGISTATTDATDLKFFIDGTAIEAVIPTETTLAVEVLINARQDNGKSGMGRYLAQIERTANSTRIVGSVVAMTAWQGDTELGTPTIAITADDTNDCLKITVTPANTTATRWGAKVIAHEVGF
jgi:hypothetical protein